MQNIEKGCQGTKRNVMFLSFHFHYLPLDNSGNEVLKRFLGKDIRFDYVDVTEIFFRKNNKNQLLFFLLIIHIIY